MKKIYTLFLLLNILLAAHSQIIQVKHIYNNFPTSVSNPRELFDYNGTLFFRGSIANGSQIGLWKSDGTQNGTIFIKNVDSSTQPYIGYGYNFIPFNGNLFFTGGATSFNNGTIDVELWKTDGSSQGTTRVIDLNPGLASSNPNNLTILNPTTMLFEADNGVGGRELWKTDGTSEGTVNITNFPGNLNGISWMKKLGNNIIMGQGINYELGTIIPKLGNEVYKTNGELGDNHLVKEVRPAIYPGVNRYAVNALGTIFFIGDNGNTGWELFKTDGSTAGTVLVKDIKPGIESSQIPNQIATLGNNIYFTTNTNNSNLWKSNGTANGTQAIPLPQGVFASNIYSYVTSSNGAIYFFANEGQSFDLYTTNGSVTTKLLDCNAGVIPPLSLVTNFVELDGFVYFAVASNLSAQKELWRTDGTPTGTVLVASLFTPFVNPQSVSNITVSNNKIFFAGVLNEGNELMMLDPSSLKTNNNEFDSWNVYPNPSNGSLTIDFDFTNIAKFSIHDILGNEVIHGLIENKKIETTLKNGVYILKIEYQNQFYIKKITIVN